MGGEGGRRRAVRIGRKVLKQSKISLMDEDSGEHRIRFAAFELLGRLSLQYGEVLPSAELRAGFTHEGHRVPLTGTTRDIQASCAEEGDRAVARLALRSLELVACAKGLTLHEPAGPEGHHSR